MLKLLDSFLVKNYIFLLRLRYISLCEKSHIFIFYSLLKELSDLLSITVNCYFFAQYIISDELLFGTSRHKSAQNFLLYSVIEQSPLHLPVVPKSYCFTMSEMVLPSWDLHEIWM